MRRDADTLKELGLAWLPYVEGSSILVLIVGLLASVVLNAFQLVELGKGAFWAFSLSVVLGFAHYFLFFGIVRCPQCRKSLTRFKERQEHADEQGLQGPGRAQGLCPLRVATRCRLV